jgi:hypothetical protein
LPELAWAILGSYWGFSDAVQCKEEPFTLAVILGKIISSNFEEQRRKKGVLDLIERFVT